MIRSIRCVRNHANTKSFSAQSFYIANQNQPSENNAGHRQWRSFSSGKVRRKKRGGKKNLEEHYNDGEKKKIIFQSLGCPRNFVDTEVMLGYAVSPSGGSIDGGDMELTDTVSEADVVVINTCGFLESAREESMAAIADAQEAIREKNTLTRRESKLVVTGCMVNLPKQQDKILQDFPGVDAILPSGNIDSIVKTIRELDGTNETKTRKTKRKKPKKNKGELSDNESAASTLTSRKQRRSFLEKGETPRFLATPPHYTYLKIAEGCRKRCSFCVIPKLKGRLQSKPIPQVVEEFQAIINHGTAQEVILIAQDLGDYGLDFDLEKKKTSKNATDAKTVFDESNGVTTKSHLTILLEAMLSSMDANDENSNLDDDPFWLRLLYLYPDEITPDLIDLMESDRRIVRYVDLPIQHSHDDILKAMRRKTNSDHIKKTITKLRERLPDIYIRTSLMVGFPGETEEHFQDLLEFVRKYKLDHVGVFIYSNEEMAHSSLMDNQVPEDVKQDRYERLMVEQWKVVEERHKERVERSERLRVVVEGLKEVEECEDEEDSDVIANIVGRHAGQCPEIDGQVILEGEPRVYAGERYWVEITGYNGYDLIGRVLEEENF